jgi:hypothetical protein
MNPPPLHLCIATGQNLANLIPALQCGAAEVWLLRTPAMRDSAAHLATALKARGIAVKPLDFADDAVTTLHAQAEAIAEQLDGRAVTINLSGGTKLMTLALVQTLAAHLGTAAPEARPHLVYTDTAHRRLDWLAPAPRSEPMRAVLRIDDVLLAQGYRRQGGTDAADWQRRAGERAALTRFMGDNARALERFFGTLNHLAQKALNEPAGPWRPEQGLPFPPGGKPAELLRLAREHGLLHWDDDTQLVFHDADAAGYLGGGWVEEYAGFKLSGMRFDGGWAPRLRIEHVDRGTTNELDAVAVHGNRLLVVECKAARAGADKVADWVYKASQLARSVGGQFAQPLLLSARPLDDAHRQRAREYGVDVIDGADLGTLPDYLRQWMNGG